ncbi:hypothetical protein PROFUN_01291 [Planoprotostelium fungivorum]|uniref:PAS domain-containing protein n=1 Tax=Planoprotostelium fungivorum TaxID=1890364 RepID=A0A2P6NZS9_9EUKA|nr:hypothetical protein PROFUN_01291 [Planoprotostelium fungivorum]
MLGVQTSPTIGPPLSSPNSAIFEDVQTQSYTDTNWLYKEDDDMPHFIRDFLYGTPQVEPPSLPTLLMDHDLPPSLWLSEPYEKEQVLQYLAYRGVDGTAVFTNNPIVEEYKQRIKDIRSILSKEQRSSLLVNFKKQLQDLIEGANMVQIPVIIWGRGHIIYFLNTAFRKATNCKLPHPPPPVRGGLFELIDEETIKKLIEMVPTVVCSTDKSSSNLKFVFRNSVGGRGIITVKRDLFGLPHLYCLHFIPDVIE